jgi:rhomboid protease GluP
MDDLVIAQYGQWNRYVLEGGAYWQLFTAMFVHINIVHLVGNMFFLFIFGLRAEGMFDIKEYLLIYFLSGFAGNLLTLLFGLDMISAGASGALFGMFGAVTIYVRRAIGQSITSALLYAFFLLILSAGFGVNVLAHLGGLVVGLLLGYTFAAMRRSNAMYEYRYSYST